jgi:2'-5' RNA ligase
VADALDAAPLARCSAVLGPEVLALGRRVVCLPVAGLDDLAAGVVAATAGFGRPPEPRPFHGHLTLARVTRGSLRDLLGEPVSARFGVRAVRLVRSRLGPQGARYDDVHVRRLC